MMKMEMRGVDQFLLASTRDSVSFCPLITFSRIVCWHVACATRVYHPSIKPGGVGCTRYGVIPGFFGVRGLRRVYHSLWYIQGTRNDLRGETWRVRVPEVVAKERRTDDMQ